MAKTLKILGSNTDAPAAVNALNLPVGALRPSPTNRTIDTSSDDWLEFVESVRKQGVIQALVVRHLTDEDGTDGGLYEIMAGERRWRAANAAGRETVPCTIRDLTDPGEILGLQISENLQRLDYEPLELAAQLQKLRDMGKSLADIGALTGKSAKKVSDILAVLGLSDELKPLYTKGYLPTSHVLYVARMMPAVQEQAVRAIFRGASSYKNGKYVDLSKLPIEQWVAHIEGLEKEEARPVTEREFREWRNQNVNLKLSSAAWKLDDADLFAEAGACTTCPQRSVNSPELYSDLAGGKDLCMNPACYQTKAKNLVVLKKTEAKEESVTLIRISEKPTHQAPAPGATSLKKNQWVSAPNGKCEGVTKALLVDGDSAGKEMRVCTDVQCKVHRHDSIHSGSIRASETPEQKLQREVQEAEDAAEEQARLAMLLAPRIALVDSFIASPNISVSSALRLMLSSHAEGQGWEFAAKRLQWGEVPRGWEERPIFVREKLAQLKDDELAAVAFLYEFGAHLDCELDDLEDEDNAQEFCEKMALLGVPSDQLAAFDVMKGDK